MSDTPKKPIAVAVDAYSSGNFFPESFAKLGVDLVHVQSTPELMPSMLAPQFDKFVTNVVHKDLSQTVQSLTEYAPCCVFAGQEPGVPLADAVSEAMGLPSNGSKLSIARRNKYEMIETLRKGGVRSAAQITSADPNEVTAWLRENDVISCVVKPLQSASTDGVTICKNTSAVPAAIERVLNSEDIFGDRNMIALIQEFLEGEEYIVDTVSHDGNHFVCGIWRYQKKLLPNGANVYERDILLSPTDPVVKDLVAYTKKALDTLGIAFGPAHSEVIITPDGPTLVETGARLNGDMHPKFHDICFGHNQADLTALQYVDPEKFLSHYSNQVYQMLQPATVFHAVSETFGEVKLVNTEVVSALKALPSVYTVQVKMDVGGQLKKTNDLLSSPIRVFLTHPDTSVIDADCVELERLQHQIFQV